MARLMPPPASLLVLMRRHHEHLVQVALCRVVLSCKAVQLRECVSAGSTALCAACIPGNALSDFG